MPKYRHEYARVGEESLPATAEQMVRLVLKGSNKTYESLRTDNKAEDYAFTILANTLKVRTSQEWNKKYLLSFGLVTSSGNLTNAIVNHFIHRDYTVMGGEVHLDIYDDRLTVTSPGGMYNGMLIQDLNIADVSSERRNPILANVMAQLDYMEKRGSGLTRICNETQALDGYKDELKPVFRSTPTQVQTIIFASSDSQNVGDFVGDMSETKLTERQQKMLNLIKESPTISAKQMSETLSVTTRTIERDLSLMKKAGFLKREGKDNDGKWIVID